MLYFYIALCVILLLFIIMTFYLIIIRQMTVQKFYIPVALFLGLIFQCLVTVHGVPDEQRILMQLTAFLTKCCL